ncbi:MAG: sodium-dependent bicarbonate transport family permease, partial [Rickettsiales bacterium]
LALPIAVWLGLSAGGAALFVTLAASASYIAVPAAMRLALPQAKPSIYLTMSLGLTFPFNLAFGIPAYIALGRMFA